MSSLLRSQTFTIPSTHDAGYDESGYCYDEQGGIFMCYVSHQERVQARKAVADEKLQYLCNAMDPVSIITGVVGTAAVALHTSRRLWELLDGIINGPTELVAMRRDTRDLFNILASLEPVLREKESKEDKDIFDVIQRLNQPLDNCMEILKALEVIIQKSVKPTGELRKSRWRTFAMTFREKELKGLTDQLINSKLTLELALTTINTIRNAHIRQDTNRISEQIAELMTDLRNTDDERVQLASIDGRRGSDAQTHFGFALERFLENVTLMDRPPSQDSLRSNMTERIENSDKISSNVLSDETLVDESAPDRRRRARKVRRVEFHPVNTSVYDGRWSIPSTYEDITITPVLIDATDRAGLHGNIPIHTAVIQGQVGLMEDLLPSKPDLEAVDDHGLTALHKAASISRSSQVAIIRLLIDAGAKIDSKDDLGANPLHHAAWQGCDEAACFLLRYNADPFELDYAGWTPLQLAVYQGNTRTVERLLSNDSKNSVNVVGPATTTALIWAAENGHTDIVHLLLRNGASVNFVDCHGSSALDHAAANGFADVVEALVNSGASIESENHKGARPLQVAAQYGQSEAAEALLSLGANPNVTGSDLWPALHQAAARGHINIINALMKGAAFVEMRGHYNKTAIIWAGEIGQSGSIRSLIGHGANFNAQDQFGETALHYASANGHSEVTRVLCSKGANPGISNSRRRQPLHGATSERGGIYSTAKILLDHGADASAKDETGCTPLHYAAQNGNERLVRLLLEHRADSQAMNLKGELPVTFAKKNGHLEVARILIEHENR